MPQYVYQARSDRFDNSRTGYYATEDEALEAFWSENHLSGAEAQIARPYVRKLEITTDLLVDADYLAREGSPSPALGIAASA